MSPLRLCTSFAAFRRLSFALGLGLLLTQLPALPQSATGNLTGVVTDPQGAALVGAEVVVTDPSTSSRRTAVTNDVGRYNVVNIPPGVYDVTITKQGFTSSKLSAQRIEIGSEVTLDVAMTIGATNTIVEVKANAGAELQTLNATIGATISNDALNLLPNLGRDASTLSVLQVGVSLTGNVAGSATDQNKYQLDGGNNSDDMAGTNTTYTPGNGFSGSAASGGTPTGVMPTPIESIEEVKIATIGTGADFNGAAGSSVQMVTKRGTNGFHGALYEYYFGSNVGAANLWRNNHVLVNGKATPLPATHRNRYGVAVGGPMTPRFWGGKTYFFFNYEASRFPNVVSFEKGTPTALFRAGVITLGGTAYNLNPSPVTVNGTTYQPAQCAGGPCDPRNLGLNPIVKALWDKMPLPNDPSYSSGSAGSAGYVDGVNAQGFLGNLALPQKADGFVGRIDHDFGDKWKFFTSYRYYNFTQLVNTQVDVGGLLGGQAGSYYSTASRPQKPGYWVAGLTGQLTPNLTNDFRFSYLRNFWQWYTKAGPPQIAGLGGAVEIGGESLAGSLIPYNVDSQDVRQRFWDGHDYYLSDSLSYLKGKHFFQFGGTYQRNFDYHGRDDNGVGINTSTVYQVYSNTGISLSSYPLPNGMPASLQNAWAGYYAEVLGIVGQTQVMYSRSGANLALNPLGTPGFDQSVIPSYDVFFNDTWRVKPSLTLSYGLSWGLAMPPYEINGKQVQMVDLAGNPIALKSYLNNRISSALRGEVYNPTIGFATIGNAAGGQNKYPYNPFYGGFSPHVSVAWNPKASGGWMGKIFGNNETVIRGGYGRTYGRLNGVDLLLVPLLGPGLLQAVSCLGPTIQGTCGVNNATPSTAFRIGKDGNVAPLPAVTQTLPQPFFPGLVQNGILNSPAADGSQLDPSLKPNHSDNFTFSIQRSFGSKMVLEVGYIGRKISDEFQEINPNAVPTMTTLGGQSFAQAFSAIYSTVAAGGVPAAQPFFEAALGGANSTYCAGFSSCTAALASKQNSNIKTTAVYNLWAAMNQAPGWTLGRTQMDTGNLGNPANISAQLSGAFDFITSLGRSNYNAGFVSFTAKDWHGLTARNNFTYGKSLGTGSVVQASSSITVPNPYDFNTFGTYGVQPFDVKFTYSLLMFYQSPFFKSQHGVMGKVLGGWTIAPLFTARTGLPQRMSVGGNAQAFGEIYSGQSSNYENAAGASPYTGDGQPHYNVTSSGAAGASGNPASKGSGINLFADPQAVYNQFRRPILGTDFNSGGAGVIRGFPFWNLDATISKDFRATEKIGATLTFQFVNLLNHFVPADPTTNIDSAGSFGVVTNQFTTPNGAQSRAIEFGLRVRF